MEPSEGAHILI